MRQGFLCALSMVENLFSARVNSVGIITFQISVVDPE
jgi:hypothetical protein